MIQQFFTYIEKRKGEIFCELLVHLNLSQPSLASVNTS
jgi:hypothetical protein